MIRAITDPTPFDEIERDVRESLWRIQQTALLARTQDNMYYKSTEIERLKTLQNEARIIEKRLWP